jgi:putative transposase
MDGHKEVLGLWIAQTEGAKFWLQVVVAANRKLTHLEVFC